MAPFSWRRVRFHFTAIDELRLPRGTAANSIRGAFGLALHSTAPLQEYTRLFKPRAVKGPSGLADPPRPFVFRCAHLEGLEARPGGAFHFDVHFFDLADQNVARFEAAFSEWGNLGLGARRARVRLERVERFASGVLALNGGQVAVERAAVRFVTPTELKSGGVGAERPEFPIFFARVRDRVATLCALYGHGALDLDFAAIGARAGAVQLTRCAIEWERGERRSGASGQVHPLGGFVGEAEYAGNLGEFLPWLRAAEWTGVGRQTVWGKGEVRVIS